MMKYVTTNLPTKCKMLTIQDLNSTISTKKMDRLKFLMLTKIHYNRNTIVCVCLSVVFFMVVKLKGVVHFKKKLLLIIYSPP